MPLDIRKKALELGWDDVGITDAVIPEEDIASYKHWIGKQNHAGMQYMEKEIRCFPEKLLPEAKTAILFISYYKQEKAPLNQESGLVAAYARGRDYHNVHHRRLKKFIRWLEEETKETGIAKGFSDSAPILEKALAVRAGLGWFGKNTLLIHRKFGTYTLLSGCLTTLDLPAIKRNPREERCGSCTKCLDACPTNALKNPYELDASLCLSYHLIESKKPIPDAIAKKNPGYIFGCDICQEACPHNVRKKPAENDAFSPDAGLGAYLDLSLIEEIEEEPERLFGTPLKRRGAEGLKYTHTLLQKNR